MHRSKLLLLTILLSLTTGLFSQQGAGVPDGQWVQQATALEAQAANLAASASGHLQTKTARLNKQWIKQEAKLARLFKAKDSMGALLMAESLPAKMEAMQQRLTSPDSLLAATGAGSYIARLDSLGGAIQFLKAKAGASAREISKALEPLNALKARLGLVQEYSEWLSQRQQNWRDLLNADALDAVKLPAALSKLKTDAGYYQAQLATWKETLNDPAKLEAETLKWLQKVPAFKEFMSRNGELARLFGQPGSASGANPGQVLAGLQTRQGMMQALQSRFGSLQQVNQALNQQLQTSMTLPSQAQQQLGSFGSHFISGTMGNANLTPYQQESADLKTKSLGKRLDFGWNLQTGVRVQNFPSVNDLGLSLGYKVNPKSVMGIGVAYKFGLGSIQKIQFTHEGIALRSFADIRISSPRAKMFSNIWLSGGFEMNYWVRFDNLPPMSARAAPLAWQRSGLIGLTKKMKVGKREGKMQVLWDFLNPQPAGSMPFQLRWGTSF